MYPSDYEHRLFAVSRAIKKKKKLPLSGVKDYLNKSCLHGLHYISNPKLSYFERSFWTLSFVTAAACATYFIYHIGMYWKNDPVVTGLNPCEGQLNDVPFPAITICNMNRVRKSEAERILSSGNDLEKVVLKHLQDFNFTDGRNLTISGDYRDIRRVLLNVKQNCSEMLKSCLWRGEKINCMNLFQTEVTDEGPCCTINRLPMIDRYKFDNEAEAWRNDSTKKIYSWSPETGFSEPDVGEVMVIPLRPQGAGAALGLTVLLDAEVDEYFSSTTDSKGFKVSFSAPTETSYIKNYAALVSTGMEHRYNIEPFVTEATGNLRNVPFQQRGCYFQDEKPLYYFVTYTENNCNLECISNYTIQQCNCIPFYYPRKKSDNVCSFIDDECVRKSRKNMQLIYGNISNCDCLPDCFQVKFYFSRTSARLFKIHPKHELDLNITHRYFMKNMAVLNFQFREGRLVKVYKTVLYGFIDGLSNIGGLLGLFLGFSFLSFLELFYFFTLKNLCRFVKNAGRKKRKMNCHDGF